MYVEDKEKCSMPFAAGLIGGIIGTLTTLTAFYMAKRENREAISDKLSQMKDSLSDVGSTSKKKLSQTLRSAAEQLDNDSENG